MKAVFAAAAMLAITAQAQASEVTRVACDSANGDKRHYAIFHDDGNARVAELGLFVPDHPYNSVSPLLEEFEGASTQTFTALLAGDPAREVVEQRFAVHVKPGAQVLVIDIPGVGGGSGDTVYCPVPAPGRG